MCQGNVFLQTCQGLTHLIVRLMHFGLTDAFPPVQKLSLIFSLQLCIIFMQDFFKKQITNELN